MTTPFHPDPIVAPPFPVMPSWVAPGRAQDVEEAAFLSGTALAVLDVVLRRDEVPPALPRDRLALRAAEASVAISGRPERAGELRDALHLLRPGELPGPAGAIFVQWRRAAARPVSVEALARILPEPMREHVPDWLKEGRGVPGIAAARVLEAVLALFPREEASGLILADAVLARVLGWKMPVPLTMPSRVPCWRSSILQPRQDGKAVASLIAPYTISSIFDRPRLLPVGGDKADLCDRLQ